MASSAVPSSSASSRSRAAVSEPALPGQRQQRRRAQSDHEQLGLTKSTRASSQKRQALISPAFGFWWMRRLPRGSNLKCFTALVT